jgi:hypothetical protein
VPVFFAYFAKRVGDGDHRCTLGDEGRFRSRKKSQTGETTLEAHPSKNEGWGTRLDQDVEIIVKPHRDRNNAPALQVF